MSGERLATGYSMLVELRCWKGREGTVAVGLLALEGKGAWMGARDSPGHC